MRYEKAPTGEVVSPRPQDRVRYIAMMLGMQTIIWDNNGAHSVGRVRARCQ